jgi:hypothetical protein
VEATIEATIDEVVRLAGGQRVHALLPANFQQSKNADYFFSTENVIAELKSLQQESFDLDYRQKMNEMTQDWMRRGLIYAFGRPAITLRTLPPPCQHEWMRLLTLPLQTNVISVANTQIKETKKILNKPEAQGLLIIANEGNPDFEPYNLMLLVANILKKRKPDGSLQYSSIHAVSALSYRLLVSSPRIPGPAFFWLNGQRPTCSDTLRELQARLETAWYATLLQRVGHQIPRYQLSTEELEAVKFL